MFIEWFGRQSLTLQQFISVVATQMKMFAIIRMIDIIDNLSAGCDVNRSSFIDIKRAVSVQVEFNLSSNYVCIKDIVLLNNKINRF